MNKSNFAWSANSAVPASTPSLIMNSSLSNLLSAPPFRPQSTNVNINVNDGLTFNGQLSSSRRQLQRSMSVATNNTHNNRTSNLKHHRNLQRSTSFESHASIMGLSAQSSQHRISGSSSPTLNSGASTPALTSSGYRSRETGIIEKLLVSYGFIKCADREGRLFFHYSQFHGEATNLRVNDEVEFEVSLDNRTGKPVAIQVIRLQKGTVMFEILSEERVLGEVTSPAPPSTALVSAQNSMSGLSTCGLTQVNGHGYKPNEKGEQLLNGRLGSLSYERCGEFFFLPYSANDLTNPNLLLCSGDKVSFNIATEKRTGVMRARKITLVERAPPKRFFGIVTAMKESFGFIERADQVKEIFFHYSEVTPNVPDLNIGDHVEFSIHERNSKDVATEIKLLPHGSVQLEEVSSETYIGSIELPLPAKTPNKSMNNEQCIAGGDATSPNPGMKNLNGITNNGLTQPSLALAGIISYVSPTGKKTIRFGEKDRAANCLHTLCKGDKVTFVTITDKRDGQQRAAGVSLMLQDTLYISKEKRENGIVAAVKEGFGFIKCVERESRLFFHCCELLDPRHHIRMSDEVEFTVLPDPVAEKQRMHATRISILPKNSVVFHSVSSERYYGKIVMLPSVSNRAAIRSPGDFLFSNMQPTTTPGTIAICKESSDDEDCSGGDYIDAQKLTFTSKDFRIPSPNILIGDKVNFKICEVKRSGATNAVDIVLMKSDGASYFPSPRRSISHCASNTSDKLSPLYEEAQDQVSLSLSKMSVECKNSPSSANGIDDSTEDIQIERRSSKSNEIQVSRTLSVTDSEISNKTCTSAAYIGNNSMNESTSSISPELENKPIMYGWIGTLKDSFGFIEDLNHNSEIFFHFSELKSSVESYHTGMPVSYNMGVKDEKQCALNVEISSISKFGISPTINKKTWTGKVLKPLKSVNPTQSSYQGLIEYRENASSGEMTTKTISYSPLSLEDRRDFIQIGDQVTFQVCREQSNNTERAVNVKVNRETQTAQIDSIKGEYGFIDYEVSNEAGVGKLFFHMSEVRDEPALLSVGSTVEFSVVYNQRSGKYSASKVKLINLKVNQSSPPTRTYTATSVKQNQRPERLRVKSLTDSFQQSVIRQPKGPTDDHPGFVLARTKKTPTKKDSPKK